MVYSGFLRIPDQGSIPILRAHADFHDRTPTLPFPLQVEGHCRKDPILGSLYRGSHDVGSILGARDFLKLS